ncbi:MAG: AMIN domain-containing protein [Okeania sp. SIO2F4]|uniref:AMIN domain-containing protein n=1 Tax=Okeania sp. SIO2F4 TaxID=2607790 RepID=UPI00142A63BE|nr:AMIN domain-containing protein [Okeania sp. SIO2F4]NES04489.1 AMIN domain-containing protein [Okeania sp. SIO2F4]
MASQYQKNLSKLKSIFKLIGLVGTLTINFSLPRPVLAAFLTNWFFDPDNNQLQFTLPAGTIPSYSVENQPARLVVYIPDTEVSVNVTELYPAGLVRRVSLAQEQPTQAKVVIDFAPEVAISTKQVKLEQVEPQQNSWQLRLLVGEGEISEAAEESIILDGNSVEPAITAIETTEPEVDTVEAAITATETIEVENSESTVEEDNQASTPPKQDRVGFLETDPKAESPLPNPPPSADPSIPFLVIPTDKPDSVNSPLIDALGNQQPPTEPSEIAEVPQLQAKETEDTFVPPPPEPEPVEEPNYSNTKSVDVISFGEPLPGTSGKKQSEDDTSILIEEGEIIGLIYPTGEVTLPRGIEIQEVLLLEEAIADESGRIIVPAKTPVVGGFDSNSHGSKFTARAIYINGRFIPFSAESEFLRGHRHVNGKVLGASSAGGGLALLLLTGSGFGFLAGAALGAGTVVLTSPREPVTVEADEIVEVLVVEDLPRSRFYDISNF